MGTMSEAVCKECSYRFRVNEGGGFTFHLLRCIRCGRDKRVPFEKLGDTHRAYLKGLSGPYSVATDTQDGEEKARFKGEPISEKEFEKSVEKYAGKCRCGGTFKFNGRVRCPKCRSTRVELELMVMYD